MSKNLLVTLADKDYLDQAKQLFSGAYFNAGWQGDYMLLSHDIPEEDLKWFRNKGILIKECQPLYKEKVGGMSEVLTTKFYLFTPEFKKWNNIIYVDSDVIVRASLDTLTQVNGFAAVRDPLKLSEQFIEPKIDQKDQVLHKQLKENYDLKSKSFNAGVFVFNTKLIEDDTFDKLSKLTNKYHRLGLYGDQSIYNIFFYKKWEELPPVYNVFITGNSNHWHIKLKKIKGIVFHFVTADKPWHGKGYFYQEWKDGLNRADEIELKNIPAGKHWTKLKIISYSAYLTIRYSIFYALSSFFNLADKIIGQLGIFLKRYTPRLYWALKRVKGVRKQ